MIVLFESIVWKMKTWNLIKKWRAEVSLQCLGLEFQKVGKGIESPSAQAYDGKNKAIFIL